MGWRRVVSVLMFIALSASNGANLLGVSARFVDGAVVGANEFSTAASFGQPSGGGPTCLSSAPSGMSLMTGFESGRITSAIGSGSSFFYNTVGAANLDASVARSGTYSLRVAPTATPAYAGHLDVQPTSAMTAHFAVRLQAATLVETRELFGISNGGAASFAALLGYSSDAGSPKLRVQLRNGAGSLTAPVQMSSTVTVGQWHVVDLVYNASGTTHTLDWRVDGIEQPSTSQPGTPGTLLYGAWAGSTAPTTYVANYDDVQLSESASDYPLRDGAVKRLTPDGMGASNLATSMKNETGTTTDAATWWQKLDETPAGATADYIRQTAVDTTAFAEVTFSDATDSCIGPVLANLFSTASGANKKATSELRIIIDGTTTRSVWNGTLDLGAAGAVNGIGAFLSPTASGWTAANLNGLKAQVGFTSTLPNGAATPRWDALEIQYLATH